MSWSGWSARLNVTSIVSQGLEQVSKLKEDVEKQFDQAVQSASKTHVTTAGATGGASASNGGLLPVAALGAPSSGPDLFGSSGSMAQLDTAASSSTTTGSNSQLPLPILKTVDDINVIKMTQWGSGASGVNRVGLQHVQQPPYSADGKRRPPSVDFLTKQHIPESKIRVRGAAEANSIAGGVSAVGENHGDSFPSADDYANSLEEEEKKKTSELGESGADSALATSDDAALKPSLFDETLPEPPTEMAANDEDDSEEEKVLEEQKPVPDAEESVDALDSRDEVGQTEALTPNETTSNTDAMSEDGTKDNVSNEERNDGGYEDQADAALPGLSTEHNGHVEIGKEDDDDVITEPTRTEALTSENDGVAQSTLTSEEAAALAQEISSVRQHLKAREAQLMVTSSTIQELHDELDKTCQREVTAVERARFLTEQLELMRLEVSKLNRMAAGQRDSDLQAMHIALSEKDEKLKGLLEEGQALSIKQAQFEQRVRVLRKEKNEEEELRLKVQAQYDTIAIQFQDQTAKLKAVEDDNKKFQLEIRQLQSTADTATKQLSKAEQDVATYETQIQELKAQVEQLTQRNEEMEQEIIEMKHASHSNAALSSEKLELEQTIRFLHQSLQDLEEESSRREEMARGEILDLKKKWQGAVSRVDMMGQSVSEATQPLLRQINALQDDQRARQETWKATEATLLQRIHESSELRRELEHDKLTRDEQIHTLQTRIEALEQEAKRWASELTSANERAESALTNERERQAQFEAVQIERDEWKAKCQNEAHAKEQLQLRLNSERNSVNKIVDSTTTQQADIVAREAAELEEVRAREAQLRHDLEWHQKELRRLKTLTSLQAPGSSNGSISGNGSSRGNLSHPHHRRQASFDSDDSNTSVSANETQASILKHTLETTVDDSPLGSTSVLGMSQLQQRLRLKEGENRLVKQQLSALEAKQSQLTEEIVRLSTRNALLETNEVRFQQTQEELQELKQRQHVLLELFGEKEEQVEELQSEVGELKAFYRQQLDTLAKNQEQHQGQ